MATSYAPVSGNIVVDECGSIKKYPLPSAQRSFPAGTPLWTNGAGGVEPAGAQAGDATSLTHANGVFAPLFAGIAAEGRIPQQLAALGSFNAGGAAVTHVDDASKPFLSVYDKGIAEGPCDALGAQHEIGEFVQIEGFLNEAVTGFYDSTGTLQQDAHYYLFNNKIGIATTQDAAHSIGILCERALAGATSLKFKFTSAVLG